MKSTWLITGQAGYVGSHLIPYLLARNPEPFLQCDLKTHGDFADLTGCEFDTVVHLAASASVTQSLKDPDACLDNNALKLIPFLTKNKIRRLIFTSTGGAIYGEKHQAKEEDANWNGCISPYGQSKYLAEQIIHRLQPNHVILRLGNVYGGDDSDRLELAAHARFKRDNPITVYGGNQVRDFVHVNIVCRAIHTALTSDITGTFNIGSGEATQVSTIAEKIGFERNVPVVYESARAGEITHISLDVTKAREAGLII